MGDRGARLPCVRYHDSFWVTIGTAAPVIALATVVAISDILRSAIRFPQRGFAGMFWPTGRGVFLLVSLLLVITLTNMAIQFVALSFALKSLAYGKNEISPTIIVAIVPLGIILLVISAGLTGQLALMRRRAETVTKEGREDTQTAQAPSKPVSQSAGSESKSDDPPPSQDGAASP